MNSSYNVDKNGNKYVVGNVYSAYDAIFKIITLSARDVEIMTLDDNRTLWLTTMPGWELVKEKEPVNNEEALSLLKED